MTKAAPSKALPLNLDRPLAIFDIESTGTNRKLDRIIDLAILKILPDGKTETHTFRCNPGMPIPPEASAVHGIFDADVKDAPPFAQKVREIAAVLETCDLAGFNILGFDIPVLCEEFARAGMEFSVEGRRILDAQRIFHRKVPRDLPAALQYYCGEMHLDAHDAMEDVNATLRVIQGQLSMYPDLPRTMDEMDAYCNPRDPSWVDRTGKFRWAGEDIVVNFGKKQGEKLKNVVREEPSFLNWMLRSDFPRDTQDIIRNALNGKYPPKPGS